MMLVMIQVMEERPLPWSGTVQLLWSIMLLWMHVILPLSCVRASSSVFTILCQSDCEVRRMECEKFDRTQGTERSQCCLSWVNELESVKAGIECLDWIVLTNEFRLYAKCNRKLLILTVGKLMRDILFLPQALDDYIISVIECFSVYEWWAFRIKLFF